MRPGLTDQLAGIRRILDEIIAPELRPGYPSQVLRGIVKNLAMLEKAWPRVLPFLEWDTETTARLLADLAPFVDDALRSRIAEQVGRDTPRTLEALERRDDELRGLLTEAIPRIEGRDDAADVRRRVTEHLVERMDRYPFHMAVAAPTKAKG